jgi:hypothetical protein
MFKGKRGKFLGIHHFLPAANEKTTGLFSQTKGWRQGFVSEYVSQQLVLLWCLPVDLWS